MGNTKIEWADKVWNPITGCSPVSEGCQNCYAKQMANRLKGRYGYPRDDPFRVIFHPERLDEPLHWKRPSRIFVCSMGDLFHEDIKWEWLIDIFQAMTYANHWYLILTKRPDRMKSFFQTCEDWDIKEWPGIYLGVSAENQQTADERIPILLQIPAAKRFVSVEPMLELVNLEAIKIAVKYLPLGSTTSYCINVLKQNEIFSDDGLYAYGKLDWVICGGETGPKARPMNSDWARLLRDQCRETGTSFFFKQMPGKHPTPKDLMIREFPEEMKR
jgi:protein gp37